MVIFLAALRQIPAALYEAASIDGASAWIRFRRITLPLLTPVIFFNVILTMIHSFQAFTQSYIVSNGTGGPAESTLLYTLYLYKRGFVQLDMGYASAMAWLLLIAIAIFTGLLFWSARVLGLLWRRLSPILARPRRAKPRGASGAISPLRALGMHVALISLALRDDLSGDLDGAVLAPAAERDLRRPRAHPADLDARELRHRLELLRQRDLRHLLHQLVHHLRAVGRRQRDGRLPRRLCLRAAELPLEVVLVRDHARLDHAADPRAADPAVHRPS